jgi:CBS-domain-containing membrane protein
MVEEVMISEITSRTSRSTERRTGSRVHTHQVRRIPIMDTLETVLEVVTMDDLITLLRNEISEMENVGRNVSA